MPVADAVALGIGFVIAIGVAILATSVADSPDDSMRWEGGVAVGFAALIWLGPLWIAQAVLTVIATFHGGGVGPGWLWAWLFLAPAVGASSPSRAVVRLAKRLRHRN